ncbi:uncharacterized protein PHACADRAFT_177147 [Phanerochaete carnosa HHB-10118-sp]|uniref:Uncharacterized protein n=1 Tax=Phanerochaete carnosa (strain HHB-10118-sp) TaxID=650164 RepID=K5VY31_PHACS|nr:uncharacterized protein PHACADRAFT_177147 [Phanerochaete carnosa HHB-10118-sp]EKM51725.1 hypothetical protein PHACADRAFT_177147 [Phanerochaete carnosa HHB-10118-sp]
MSRVALSALLAFSTIAIAQDPTGTEPLTDKSFTYPTGIPYQVDPNDGLRGPQSGYNICNSTTEGPASECQTGFINHINDWCVWAPPTGPTTIGESEGQEVAWCTQPGRGTRLIPAGAITGVQFLRAPSYLEVIAFIDQSMLNIQANDSGGELDPHGADLRGNPIGGLVFSNNLPQSGNGDNNTFVQVEEWHNFIGSNLSCFKACDPKDPNAGNYCFNRLDRVGIDYVCPNQAQNNSFVMCDSDNQLFPGVYTTDGITTSYTQPPDSVPIGTLPYTPIIPSSSNCVTFQSSDLFAQLPTPSGASSAPAATSSGASAGSGSGSVTPSRTGASSTGTASPTGGAQNSGAGSLRVSVFATMAGVVFAIAFFA